MFKTCGLVLEGEKKKKKIITTTITTTKLRQLPTSGRTSDVGGMFSATSIRNTVIDSKVVMPIDTFSPELLGM